MIAELFVAVIGIGVAIRVLPSIILLSQFSYPNAKFSAIEPVFLREKEIARLSLPLFSPQYHWEKTGNVSNVVFPTGTVIYNNSLFIYYGCADKRIGFAEISLKKLLTELLKEKKN